MSHKVIYGRRTFMMINSLALACHDLANFVESKVEQSNESKLLLLLMIVGNKINSQTGEQSLRFFDRDGTPKIKF